MYELIYGEECRAALADQCDLIVPAPVGPAECAVLPSATLAAIDVAFTGWSSPQFDAALLARLPRLRAVFHGAGSVRPYVSEAFWQRGITLTNAAAANAVPVAEYTVSMVVLALKQVWRLNRETRQTRTFPRDLGGVRGTRGATVGLISLGLIGREVLQRLHTLEVEVLAYDPYLPAEKAAELGVRLVALPDLMARSDVVSLHSPLNAETAGFITGELLARLKPGATFINTARGGLVRETELIEFLQRRSDVQAILDVTVPEPPEAASALYDLPNVLLTPHLAGSVGDECRRMGWAMVGEFGRFVRGEPLHFSVTRDQALRQT
ncbi:hydroxyacid dehydrogenase [Horticoccus luteus]|uniref:Hydroxyacid dehydrogenase n=1 Tax=Horticoccus luteus TaxID=2862869 RepID=A0A8F9TTD1_9BACT|nr:hydroxyacid dehydrogenase [Horticoccus luteus]QYM78884.1 hydroxyacid dehydrogenase [Horticoccus luteus]